jgi:hypothetical protein
LGQACSKPSIVFIVLAVLAISYYNLWNKGVFYMHDEYQCTFVNEFNAQLVYKLENSILLVVYSIVLILSVLLLIVFVKKEKKLRCHINRDKQCEKDLLVTVILVAMLTSVMRLVFFLSSLIQISSSLEKIENIFLESHYQKPIDMDLTENIDKLTSQYSGNDSMFHFNIELILFFSSSFKIMTFLVCISKIRLKLMKVCRIQVYFNPLVLCKIVKRKKNYEIQICKYSFRDLNYPNAMNKSSGSNWDTATVV